MTRIESKSPASAVQALFSQNPDGLRDVVRTVLQEVLEAEIGKRRLGGTFRLTI